MKIQIQPINAQFSSQIISAIQCSRYSYNYSVTWKSNIHCLATKNSLSLFVLLCQISLSTDFYACFLGLPLEETKHWWALQVSSCVGLHNWASPSCNKKYTTIDSHFTLLPPPLPYPPVKKITLHDMVFFNYSFDFLGFVVKLIKKQVGMKKCEKNLILIK